MERPCHRQAGYPEKKRCSHFRLLRRVAEALAMATLEHNVETLRYHASRYFWAVVDDFVDGASQ